MSILDGRQVVATPGTAVALSDTPLEVLRVDIIALSTNTGIVALGTRNVSQVVGSETGFSLSANEIVSLTNIDLSTVWIDAAVADEGVRWGAEIDLQ